MFELNTLIYELHLSENLTFPLIIFTHFDSPDQLPGFALGGTLAINRLIVIINKLFKLMLFKKYFFSFQLYEGRLKLWKSFNAFAMSDLENSKQEKLHRAIEWRQVEVNEWW